MLNLGQAAKKVIDNLEEKFTLEYIVTEALEDREYSDLLEYTIKFEAL